MTTFISLNENNTKHQMSFFVFLTLGLHTNELTRKDYRFLHTVHTEILKNKRQDHQSKDISNNTWHFSKHHSVNIKNTLGLYTSGRIIKHTLLNIEFTPKKNHAVLLKCYIICSKQHHTQWHFYLLHLGLLLPHNIQCYSFISFL